MARDSQQANGAAPGAGAERVQDGVPPARPQRERLRRAIRQRVAAAGVTPPVDLDALMGFADGGLRAAGLESEFRHFAAVVAGNEVWRDALADVPFDRRLLLLPMCLRDRARCAGRMDDYGLLCARCGRCPMGDLVDQAERLGYAVLICEGTTVVTSLIASGQVQAVVGVGCLSSLQKVYPLMHAAGVPGVAIPLLRDGCADTAVDVEWVREAVLLGGAGRRGGLDAPALRRQVESWFTREAIEGVLGAPAGRTAEIACDWLARAGKRWRPLLAAGVFRALSGGQADRPDDLPRVAVAVECFHKASLIHDDIEDADELRYGRKTLHAEHGTAVALNVGDLLLGEGYRLLASCDAPAAARAGMVAVAAEGHRGLCLGQGMELCWRRRPRALSVAEVLDIHRGKTAPAFEVAARLGAILAGADARVGEVLRRYSRHLGIAYQIRDDLADCRGPAGGGDVGGLRPSVVLAAACELAGPDERPALAAALAAEAPPARRRALVRRIADSGAEAKVRALLRRQVAAAAAALEPLTDAALKLLLRRVLAGIFGHHEGTGERDAERAHGGRGRAGAESVA
jgi:geranylgeranyl pyrophosphate synthase